MTIIKLCVILGLLLFVSCKKEIDNDLLVYSERFQAIAKECNTEVSDYSIAFTETKEKLYGLCRPVFRKVLINKKHWVKLTTTKKEQLIFHELAHCGLAQEHDDTALNIMNTLGFIPAKIYRKHYDYFIKRLFPDCKTTNTFKYKELK